MAMGVLEDLYQALVDTTNSGEESQETFKYRVSRAETRSLNHH